MGVGRDRVRLSQGITMAISRAKRKDVFLRDNGICQFCRQQHNFLGGGWGIDHLTPASKGGTDSHNNLVTVCKKRNNQKANRTIETYRQELHKDVLTSIYKYKKCLLTRQLSFEERG